MPPLDVRFVVSNNFPGSGTRITADYANALAARGIGAEVLYPLVDWWDYKVFTRARVTDPAQRFRWDARLAWEAASGLAAPKGWCAKDHFQIHPQVRVKSYPFRPSARDWSAGQITVVHAGYQIPHLLNTAPPHRIHLVGVVHINLEEATRSPSPHVAAWYRHWLTLDQHLWLPRYAVSEAAARSAEQLGIPVRRVIHNGVDLRLFHPTRAGKRGLPLTVTLYCDRKLQKGQIYGIEALRTVRAAMGDVRLCSIGDVLPEHRSLFSHHYGYLHGEAYADALRESDVLIYPSLYDGFPALPLEALASGCALITTAVEGVDEYARDGENALLCRPRDSEGLGRQLLRLLKQEELRGRLRANGPDTAEAFSLERCADRLLEFLEEVRKKPEAEPLRVEVPA